MKNNKISLRELKVIIFEQQFSKFPYLNDFSTNPYTFLKARYYMYSSVLLVYVLLKTNITPNMVTIAYGVSGVIGGVLLAVPNIYFNIAAVLVFFNKGILDWSDGHLARLKYSPTLTGHILDEYGASINSIGLIMGVGFFSINQTGYTFLMYPIAIAGFLHSEKYTSFGKNVILSQLNKLMTEREAVACDSTVASQGISENHAIKFHWIISIFRNILDDRARSVDLVLVIVLLDCYFNYSLTLYVFLLFFLKLSAQFVLSIIVGVRSKWAESVIDNISKNSIWKIND